MMRFRITLASAWVPNQNEVKEVELKNRGLSRAGETETRVCACCGSRDLKDRASKIKKLLKESIPEKCLSFWTNTKLCLH